MVDMSEAKLASQDVAIIKMMLELGARQRHLAELYGVTRSTVGHINQGYTWKHVSALSPEGPT